MSEPSKQEQQLIHEFINFYYLKASFESPEGRMAEYRRQPGLESSISLLISQCEHDLDRVRKQCVERGISVMAGDKPGQFRCLVKGTTYDVEIDNEEKQRQVEKVAFGILDRLKG